MRTVLLALALIVTPLRAEEIRPQVEWISGRLVHGIDSDGRCVCRPFIVVGETENDLDTDTPRVIGFHGDDTTYDSRGRIVWERPAAERWAPYRARVGHIAGHMCRLGR